MFLALVSWSRADGHGRMPTIVMSETDSYDVAEVRKRPIRHYHSASAALIS